MEAASQSRNALLDICPKVWTSSETKISLISSPILFDFVAKAVRATNEDPGDLEMALAVDGVLGGTATALLDQYVQPSRAGVVELGDLRLQRSILGLTGAIVDAAKRPRFRALHLAVSKALILLISDQLNLAPNLRFSGPGLVELMRQMIELHKIVSGLEGMGPKEQFAALVNALYSVNLVRDDHLARQAGLGPAIVLLSSLMRHAAFLVEPSAPVDLAFAAEFGTAFISCSRVLIIDLLFQPNMDLSLQLSGLPEARVANIARALGICVAHLYDERRGPNLVAPVLQFARDAQLLPHACTFLEFPGCLGRIVQVMGDIKQFPEDMLQHLVHLLVVAVQNQPARMAPLLRSSDFDRLVDLALRPEAIEKVQKSSYSSLLYECYVVRVSGRSTMEATQRNILQAFSEARLAAFPSHQLDPRLLRTGC